MNVHVPYSRTLHERKLKLACYYVLHFRVKKRERLARILRLLSRATNAISHNIFQMESSLAG